MTGRHVRIPWINDLINPCEALPTNQAATWTSQGSMGPLLTVYICIKVHMDLQADKSPVVVKGPFFPRVVNPRYRIRGTMCNARIQSSKARIAIFEESNCI
jgi:hypothetical protein